eukprot:4393579-Prymnesium_polylepis.1
MARAAWPARTLGSGPHAWAPAVWPHARLGCIGVRSASASAAMLHVQAATPPTERHACRAQRTRHCCMAVDA